MNSKVVLALAVTALVVVASAFVFLQNRGQPASTTSTDQGTNSSGSTAPNTSSASTIGAVAKGLTFTPATYDSNGISNYFSTAKLGGTIVAWAGDWDELGDPKGAPTVLQSLASQSGLTLVVELQFFSSSNGLVLRPLNSTNEAHYKNLAVSFAQSYKPGYMALGVEVNVLNEHSPADYKAFVSFFGEAREAIKAVSPATRVFTIFQLERMKGLDGGLFGGTNDTGKAEWGLLADFGKGDLFGFTTYPGLLYHDPSGIPDDYYLDIASHTQKQIAFTEIGWQSGSLSGGWTSSESSQAQFVSRFFNLTVGLQRVFAIWSVLYDQNVPPPFNTMGLFSNAGAAKRAWSAWTDEG